MHPIVRKVFSKAASGHKEAQHLIESHPPLRKMYAAWRRKAYSDMYDKPPGLSDSERYMWDGMMATALNDSDIYHMSPQNAARAAFLSWKKEHDQSIREDLQSISKAWEKYFVAETKRK